MGLKEKAIALGLAGVLSACAGLPEEKKDTPKPKDQPSVEEVLRGSPYQRKKGDDGCERVIDPTKNPDDQPCILKPY